MSEQEEPALECQTCKWWVPLEEAGWPAPEGLGDCQSAYLGEPMDLGEHRAWSLSASYDEGGGIHTGPDFGCIHWSPKE